MKKLFQISVLFVIMGLLLSACGPFVRITDGAGAPTPQASSYMPQVQSVQVQVKEGNPPQVSAIVRGQFAESCATLAPSKVEYSANTFTITVIAVSPIDHGCAPATDPFETTVLLDVEGLPAGNYTVIANGVAAVFSIKSAQPAPTVAPTAVPTQASGGQACTDAAAFVTDVSVPDNVLFAPGTAFTKTWRLKNTGTCAWDSSYLVYWISGATMSQQPGYYFVPGANTVDPGETADVSVGMTAPMEVGYYTAYWGLKGRDGRLMPISGGAHGNSFFVKIRVSDSGSSGGSSSIVDQSVEVELEQGSGDACTPGATYLVHAHVSADGPLSALYEIDSTAGQISAGYFVDPSTGMKRNTIEGTVKFDASLFAADGVQTITIPLRFVGPYPYPRDITVNFWVDGGSWASAKVSCP